MFEHFDLTNILIGVLIAFIYFTFIKNKSKVDPSLTNSIIFDLTLYFILLFVSSYHLYDNWNDKFDSVLLSSLVILVTLRFVWLYIIKHKEN